jgi:hypothetical protein
MPAVLIKTAGIFRFEFYIYFAIGEIIYSHHQALKTSLEINRLKTSAPD